MESDCSSERVRRKKTSVQEGCVSPADPRKKEKILKFQISIKYRYSHKYHKRDEVQGGKMAGRQVELVRLKRAGSTNTVRLPTRREKPKHRRG